jgi:hypothetical protein
VKRGKERRQEMGNEEKRTEGGGREEERGRGEKGISQAYPHSHNCFHFVYHTCKRNCSAM